MEQRTVIEMERRDAAGGRDEGGGGGGSRKTVVAARADVKPSRWKTPEFFVYYAMFVIVYYSLCTTAYQYSSGTDDTMRYLGDSRKTMCCATYIW